MNVSYPVTVNGKTITITKECNNDQEVFKFLHHMEELYSDMVCEREGERSDKVRFNVRTDKDDNNYFELICFDPDKPACHFAKKSYGANKGKEMSLFPKNKDSEGNWRPWRKYNKTSGKEE